MPTPCPTPYPPFPGFLPADPALTVLTYVAYLGFSVLLTIWVAKTLHANGRAFLIDAFHGNQGLADSVNHLLVVGFYLINIGYVALALKYGDKPWSLQTAVEVFSTKIGRVLLVLGGMHFFNLYVFSRMRKRALLEKQPPPVPPDASLAGA
jgi:hypothetical protein